MKAAVGVVALVATTLPLASCASESSPAASLDDGQTRLEEAYENCRNDYNTAVSRIARVADDGDSLIIDAMDKDIVAVVCILGQLGTSDATLNNISTTTAMMGRQHAEEDGLTYEWTYHPDNGLQMVITD